MKNLKEMRSQAKTLQNALADEKVTVSKKSVTVTMNGNMEITDITLEPEMSNEDIKNNIKECVNEANKKAQKLMAQKMQEMGGLSGFTQ